MSVSNHITKNISLYQSRNHNIKTNLFPLEIDTIYKIKFIVNCKSIDKLNNLNTLTKKHKKEIEVGFNTKIYFIGKFIYSIRKPSNETMLIQNQQYTITLILDKVINCNKDNEQSVNKVIKIILKYLMKDINYIQNGRSNVFVNLKQKTFFQNGRICLFKGFQFKLVQKISGKFLGINEVCNIVRVETVLQHIDSLYAANKSKSIQQRRQIIKQKLKNKKIMSKYGQNKYWRIQDIENFKDISVIVIKQINKTLKQYYKQKYNLEISKLNQPILKCRGIKKHQTQICYLIPEFCLMTGLTEDVTRNCRDQILKSTQNNPLNDLTNKQMLMQQLSAAWNTLDNNKDSNNLKISDQSFEFNNKTMRLPTILIGKNKYQQYESIDDGHQTYFHLEAPIFKSNKQIKMLVIHFYFDKIEQLKRFIKQSISTLDLICQYQFCGIRQSSNIKIAKNELDKIILSDYTDNFNFLWIIIPNHMQNQYSYIKKKCLLQKKILSQISSEKKLNGKKMIPIICNTISQIAAKIGNILWLPKISLEQDIMIISYKLYRFNNSKRYFYNYTVDCNLSLLYSGTSNQNDKGINQIISQCIKHYKQLNKQQPKILIILSNIDKKMSANKMKNCDMILKDLSKTQIKLVFFEVDTNPSLRCYSLTKTIQNPPIGTCISDLIVEKENYQFYLFAKKNSNQISIPLHFKILYNNSNLNIDHLKELMFKQCFNYFNFSGSVRMPSSLQYLQKLIGFMSDTGLDVSQECLNSNLYYI